MPTITSFTPLNGTYGTVLNISGTSFTGATGVSIGGINALSFTVNSSTSITAIVGNGATGSVIVTKPGGSSSLAGFTWFPPPTITSFAPSSGPVGTTVVIAGTNFHAIAANNTIWFGTVKATITSGTTTSLTVTVPAGATYQPISVTSNNLTGYSKDPFLVTFPDGGAITENSFNLPIEISAAGYTPYDAALGDVDGDGKLDLALINFGPFVIDNAVSILRNNSSGSSVSFEPKIDFKVREPQTVALGDLDGDGKLDFAVTNADNPASLGVYRNTSTPGNISFASPLNIATIAGPNGIVITDIDGDGKPDIAITTG
ncbi:MAG TPA: FG-GAP-like repeat-containing protein, partial [Saprospiraceae bacterium]|nr:FG-GAP-like repeat-containing protein [Saprospiraceae bacterium]